ncbi:polysaccharide deacetylase family protein [Actinocorallia lasiicapitis]
MVLSGDIRHFTVSPGQPAEAAPVPTVRPVVKPSPSPTVNPPVAARRKPVRHIHEIDPLVAKNAVALTIDDGPHPIWTPKVLDLLADHEVKATFFVIGEQLAHNEKLVRRIVESGHEIANHTLTHPIDLPSLSEYRLRREITDAHKRIHETTGAVPRMFRAPGGNWSSKVYKAAAEQGLYPIDWDVDPRDWARPGVESIKRQLLRAKAGDILLCHDGGGDRSQTVASLKYVLPRLKDRGLEFVTL